MRPRFRLARCRLIAVAALVAVGGCDRLKAVAGPETTLDLLAKGSAKACIAADVEEVLRGMIRPEARSFAFTGMDETDRKRIIQSFTIGFDLATLESKDETVSRVTCNAQVVVTGASGTKSNGLPILFSVQPSAAKADRFVVTGDTSGPTAYLSGAALATMTAELLTGKRQDAAPDPDATPLPSPPTPSTDPDTTT